MGQTGYPLKSLIKNAALYWILIRHLTQRGARLFMNASIYGLRVYMRHVLQFPVSKRIFTYHMTVDLTVWRISLATNLENEGHSAGSKWFKHVKYMTLSNNKLINGRSFQCHWTHRCLEQLKFWKPTIQVVFPSTCFSTLVERLLCFNIYCVRLVTAANAMLSIDTLTVYCVSKL